MSAGFREKLSYRFENFMAKGGMSIFLSLTVLFVLSLVIAVGVRWVILLIWPDSVSAIWIATIAYGISMAGLFPGTITLASEHLHMTGGITGFFLVGSSLGAMILPWLIGQYFESIGPRVVPAFLAVTVAASIVLLAVILILLGRSKRSFVLQRRKSDFQGMRSR